VDYLRDNWARHIVTWLYRHILVTSRDKLNPALPTLTGAMSHPLRRAVTWSGELRPARYIRGFQRFWSRSGCEPGTSCWGTGKSASAWLGRFLLCATIRSD